MRAVNILLIEDNDGDVLLATQMLKDTAINYTIQILNDGEAAIRFLSLANENAHAKFPDLILLDINLPKKNGFEVLRCIKSSAKTKHLPVIMLTTSSYINDRELAQKSQADRYITKPLEADVFRSAVMELVPDYQSI